MKHTHSFAVVGAIVFALSATGMSAPIVQTETLSFSLSPGGATLTFDQFDTLGGTRTLEQVLVELNLTEQANVTAENDSALDGNMSVGLTGNATGTAPGMSVAAAINTSTAGVAVDPSDGNSGSGPDFHDFGIVSGSDTASDSLHYLTDNLSAYVGGGTVDFVIIASGGFAVSGVTDSTTIVSSFGASGDGTLTYVWTPEPGSLSLLGLGALALIRRKR